MASFGILMVQIIPNIMTEVKTFSQIFIFWNLQNEETSKLLQHYIMQFMLSLANFQINILCLKGRNMHRFNTF